jgi:hypothetical protein
MFSFLLPLQLQHICEGHHLGHPAGALLRRGLFLIAIRLREW